MEVNVFRHLKTENCGKGDLTNRGWQKIWPESPTFLCYLLVYDTVLFSWIRKVSEEYTIVENSGSRRCSSEVLISAYHSTWCHSSEDNGTTQGTVYPTEFETADSHKRHQIS
jgi:hypothetical protein